MAFINNWLAFSLSPQQIPEDDPHHQCVISGDSSGIPYASGDDIPGEVSGNCFTMSSDGAGGSMHNPFEWNSATHAYNGTMESMSLDLVGRSSTTNDAPKLEDFLGGGSATDPIYPHINHCFGGADPKFPVCQGLTNSDAYEQNSGNCMFSDCSLQLPASDVNNSIGLSMIKSWLRSQPAPHDKNGCTSSSSTNNTCAGVPTAAGNVPNVQSLSLSMSTGSQSSSTAPMLSAGTGDRSDIVKQKGIDCQSGAVESVPRKSIDTFGQRTSIYRGVTRHRWTGRFEAHLWDNSCRREGQTRKGRQVYLGGYDKEEKAARAYDLAALKYWGTTTTTNFQISNYEKELEEMKHMTRQEYIASLRRKSSGFSRGASIYRGVTRHHQHGRWQARIGRVAGNKDLYLGTFSTQEEAAEAYDIAAIKFRGLNAVTNFDMNRYDVKSILESSTLPIGGGAKRLKEAEAAETGIEGRKTVSDNLSSTILTDINGYNSHHGWPIIAFQQPQPQPLNQLQHHSFLPQGNWPYCKQERDLEDHQQLDHANNTPNFFQPSVIHNLLALNSSSMDHSASAINYQGVVNGAGGVILPLNSVHMGHHNQGSFGDQVEMKKMGASNYDNIPSVDPYSSRNLYLLSKQQQHQAINQAKLSGNYDQSSTCDDWVPNSVQAVPPRSNLSSCNAAAVFTVWNDN